MTHHTMGYHIQCDPETPDASARTHPCNPENAWPGFCMQDVGQRFYSPPLGRWLNRDPIGERGGVRLYTFVRNNGVSRVDPIGLQEWDGDWSDFTGLPGEGVGYTPVIVAGMLVGPGADDFWATSGDWGWTQDQRNGWVQKFKEMYKKPIDDAAVRHCVPKRLLAALIGNERLDQRGYEALAEGLPFMLVGHRWSRFGPPTSFGVAQLYVPYMTDWAYGHPSSHSRSSFRFDWQLRQAVKNELLDPDRNIDMAAQYLNVLIKDICGACGRHEIPLGFHAATGRILDSRYRNNLISDLCTKDCSSLVEMVPKQLLLQTMGMVWNNGSGFWINEDPRATRFDAWMNGQQVGRWASTVPSWVEEW